MLGIIVVGANHLGTFDEVIYHQLGESTIFEYTINNALSSELAQKVIVCVPSSQKKNIRGGGIYSPIIKSDHSFLGRKAIFHFYDQNVLDGIYQAALTYGLDYVALIRGNSPILPSWLINKMIYYYMSETDGKSLMLNYEDGYNFSAEFYNPGFEMTIFPFWMLAQSFLYSDDRSGIRHLYSYKNPVLFLPGKDTLDEKFLPNCKYDLRFLDLDQRDLFDFLISEVSLGADLGKLIEDLNEP